MRSKRTLIKHISESNKNYFQAIKDGGGGNHFGRALAAQILWITFWCSFGKLILSNYQIVAALATCSFLVLLWQIWDRVLSDHCPKWIDDLFSGRIFFNLDIKELNVYIGFLAFANMAVLFWPIIIAKLRLNHYEKK